MRSQRNKPVKKFSSSRKPAKSRRSVLPALGRGKVQDRASRREARRFTRENRTGKYFMLGLVSALVVLVILVLATMFTPILAIEKVVISGESQASKVKIQSALMKYIGTPLTTVNESAIASDLKNFPEIESISLVSRPPHTLEVRITERTPIAIVVQQGKKYLFDPAGVKLGVASGTERLPIVIVTGNPKNSSSFKQAIDVVLALPLQLLDRVEYIQAKTRDNVTLQLRGAAAQQVIWGDSSESILKSKVLKILLLRTPTNIRATFDVSSPRTPSVIK